MLFLAVCGVAWALEPEKHVPTIMIAARTTSLNRAHPLGVMDPLFFEKLFSQSLGPIAIRTSRVENFEHREKAEKPVIFSSRANMEDRVNDGYFEGTNLFRPHSHYAASKTNASKGSGSSDGESVHKKTPSHSVVFYICLIGLFAMTGLIGYYVGKAAESRNYVRVPSAN